MLWARGGAAGGAGGAAAPPYFGPWPPKIFWGPLDFWLSPIKYTILSNFSISMPFPFSHQFERCSGCCFLFVSLLPFFLFWENKMERASHMETPSGWPCIAPIYLFPMLNPIWKASGPAPSLPFDYLKKEYVTNTFCPTKLFFHVKGR